MHVFAQRSREALRSAVRFQIKAVDNGKGSGGGIELLVRYVMASGPAHNVSAAYGRAWPT